MDYLTSYKYKGYTVEIGYDEDPIIPNEVVYEYMIFSDKEEDVVYGEDSFLSYQEALQSAYNYIDELE